MSAIQLKGAPGSPYTRKMLAVLRYRRIPYEFLVGEEMVPTGYPEPKVNLLPTFYFPKGDGVEAVVDSTPIIRRLEKAFPGRSVLPDNPVVGFVNYLLEDFADEWLTKAMFHYRWYYAPDIEQGGTILPLWRDYQMSPEKHEKTAAYIRERQISRLYVVGSNDVTAAVIEESYQRILGILDELLQRSPFLLGSRPGSADFGFFGQLTQLAGFDPTPMKLCLEKAPRVYAWTDVTEDLSGLAAEENDWANEATLAENLSGILAEVGRVYVPFLFANAKAIAAGEKTFTTEIDNKPWQQPAFPYQAKCLQWIQEEFARLDAGQQSSVRKIVAGSGCEALLG